MANNTSIHLPEEIMLNIQTRLPVKSIIRFKSVCKPWLSLFSSQQFIKLHRSQFSSDPKNQTVIFHESYANTMSLLNIESGSVMKRTIIECPRLKNSSRGGDFMGCYNGLVCMRFLVAWPSFAAVIWNPATKLAKSVWLKRPRTLTPVLSISLRFGYDAVGDDFKLVRIYYFEEFTFDEEDAVDILAEVEVYSFNSESLVTVSASFPFVFSSIGNDETVVIVNGNPYWIWEVDGKDVLVYCDVTKLVCNIVPLPNFYVKGKVKFVDLDGALGALVCPYENERAFKSLDVWVFDDAVNVWRKTHTFDPVEGINVDRYLQRMKNGNFICEHSDGKLFVFDPDNGRVLEILIDLAKKCALHVHGYVESFACIEGMKGIEGMEVDAVFEDIDRLF